MPPEKKERKPYIGRKMLLRIIAGKSDSTKKYLLHAISQQLKTKEVSRKQFRTLARKLGVRIRKLELV